VLLTLPVFHPIFGFPSDHIAHVGVSPSICLKLISREIIFEVCDLYDPDPPTSQTDRQTDGRTGGRHAIARPRFAL